MFIVGYYYELDDSYDESDEEEVKAHLRRVAEQPPLKLDDSLEVKYQLNTWAFMSHRKMNDFFSFHPETGFPGSVWPNHCSPA